MINGNMLRDMFISASNNISNKQELVNALNVFPIPDGDTGINIAMTMEAAAKELGRVTDKTASEIADIIANATLRGARGNSGVILSLLFRGFARSVKGLNEIDGLSFVTGLQKGVESAYGAVMKPTEGTILTVARVCVEKGLDFAEKQRGPGNMGELIENIVKYAEEELERTPELLPVLKQANVVDAGGKGFVLILDGFNSAFKGNIIKLSSVTEEKSAASYGEKADFSLFSDDDIQFAYCTELLITHPQSGLKNISSLRDYIYDKGDSVVFVAEDDIIKVHVHTNNPGLVLEESIKYGQLSRIKIENMKEQHTSAVIEQNGLVENKSYIASAEREFGFVSVASGEGLVNVFKDLGVDQVVYGGQSMNPSADDILKAVNATPSNTVFVLPNNKNVIMAAELTIKMTSKNVIVIPTKTIPQGISAMFAFVDSDSSAENKANMEKAIKNVGTGQISFAVRDAKYDGQIINEGDMLGLVEGKVVCSGSKMSDVFSKVLTVLISRVQSPTLINIFYGSDVTPEEAASILDVAKNIAGDIEIDILPGGQPVYFYIISAE